MGTVVIYGSQFVYHTKLVDLGRILVTGKNILSMFITRSYFQKFEVSYVIGGIERKWVLIVECNQNSSAEGEYEGV